MGSNPTVIEQAARPGYMPQLDALRALAVGLVFVSHWADKTGMTGLLGVRLFFVLSGFLISSILLRIRDRIDAGGASWRRQLQFFYARRFLRLFPALSLLIVVLVILDWHSIRQTWGWHVTYLSNVYFGLRNDLEGPISPLWSLSVEEQFYLLWPFVILLAPKRTHFIATLSLIGIAAIWQIGMWKTGIHTQWAYVLPPKWLDGLGIGALFALLDYNGRRAQIARLKMLGKNIGLPLLVALVVSRVLGRFETVTATLFDLAVSLTFVWIVAGAAQQFGGLVGRFLEWRPLLYLGQISYGLYLFHAFVPDLFKFVVRSFAIPLTPWDVPEPIYTAAMSVSPQFATKLAALVMLMIYTLIAILIASASWYFWERPINRLRKHIPYGQLQYPGS
jgi:peptidoglycan/LPS O-acetylase OafA/YrhL